MSRHESVSPVLFEASMNAAAVVIGVNKTGGLPPLAGAVTGAKEFADWAKTQGMAVQLLTDETGDLPLSTIAKAVKEVIEARTYEKLVVYFAGHGFLLSPQTELWLLSGAPDYSYEAVNLQLSRDYARYSGIPHVIFVSDACRSGGPTHRHRSVTGAAMFSTPAAYDQDGEVDTFYATRPGDTALEYGNEQEAVDNYKGLFTECLLGALEGGEPSVVQETSEGNLKRWLVLSRPLKEYLLEAVPQRAAAISIKLSQSPEVRVETQLPKFFGELAFAPTRAGLSEPDFDLPPGAGFHPPERDLRDFVANVRGAALSFEEHEDMAVITNAAFTEREHNFTSQISTIASARGRDHYETETGFSVYGRVKSVVIGDGIDSDVFVDADVTQIRVYDPMDYAGRSILIEFESGIGTVLAVKPHFIGTVLVDGPQVINVNYTPASNSPLSFEYEMEPERIERRRAFVAAATRNGVFELESDDARDVADYLRMMKGIDPTLGIYAAYAYHQIGRLSQIRSVLAYMRSDPPPVPLDVALLARVDDWPTVAPFCPMLGQGWALLELRPELMSRLSSFRTLLQPALWTTFTPEGVALARSALETGALR